MDDTKEVERLLMDEIKKLRDEKFQLELELRRVKEEAAEVYRRLSRF